jgi:hypothetical protein
MCKVVYTVQNKHKESRKLVTNGLHPTYFLGDATSRFNYIKFYHWSNRCGKYAHEFYISMIDGKHGHILLPLIMFTCTALHHAVLKWQMKFGCSFESFQVKAETGHT